jgi:hypothetical protein
MIVSTVLSSALFHEVAISEIRNGRTPSDLLKCNIACPLSYYWIEAWSSFDDDDADLANWIDGKEAAMKLVTISAAILLAITLASGLYAQQDNFPVLTGPYLGQDPPGTYPEVFGPGIISVDENFEHSAAVFSPDGEEVYWCTNVDWYTERGRRGMLRLYYMKVVDGRWTAPALAPFATDISVERPVFSPDGNTLYFERFPDPENPDDVDIYFVRRTDDGWSDQEPVSPLINSPAVERLYCVTSDGSMYFSRNLLRSDEEIFVSRFVDGAFSEPEILGASYNSEDPELALVFGPNEEYMLTDVINAQHTSSDLCVSFRKPDGTWTDRIKTPYYCGGFLALSPDGNYLFLMGEAIYWVSTAFVDELRP